MVKNENTKNDEQGEKPDKQDNGKPETGSDEKAKSELENAPETVNDPDEKPEKPTPNAEAAAPEAERKPDATLSSDTLLHFKLGDYYEVVADPKGNPALERVEFNKLVVVETTSDGKRTIKARKEHIQGLNILSRLLIKNRKKIDDTILKKFHFWNVIGDNHELLLDSVSKLRLLKKIIDPLLVSDIDPETKEVIRSTQEKLDDLQSMFENAGVLAEMSDERIDQAGDELDEEDEEYEEDEDEEDDDDSDAIELENEDIFPPE